MKFFTFILILSFAMISCKKESPVSEGIVQYVENKQRLNVNGVDAYGNNIDSIFIKKIGDDTVNIGEKVKWKFILSDNNYQIKTAFMDCIPTSESFVDTTTFKIDDCFKRLLVVNDTVLMEFKIGEKSAKGMKKYHDIVVVSADKANVFRYHQFSTYLFLK